MSDAASQPTRPRLNILTQFVKHVSFENIAASERRNPAGQPQISVQVHAEHDKLDAEQYLVSLIFSITAVDTEDKEVFAVDLDYAALARLRDATEEQIDPVLSVECPQLMFPFARRMIADVTREGGFPPLMLDPINFAQLYLQQRLAQQKAKGDGQAPAPADADAETTET